MRLQLQNTNQLQLNHEIKQYFCKRIDKSDKNKQYQLKLIAMFIIILTYQKSLNEVDQHLEAHKRYLEKFCHSDNFIVSGRQVPRTGGVILCKAYNREEVEHIVSQDPFYIHEIATYQIIEFEPTQYSYEALKGIFTYI